MLILNPKRSETVVTAVSLMLIMLFVYAAATKLMDMRTFIYQIKLSPLIPDGFHVFVAYLMPVAEIVTGVLLCFKYTRRIALYASYFLMLMFTFYLYFLLKYSTFIPCSCGGILGKMSWETHIIFNLLVSFMAGFACYLEEKKVMPDRQNIQLKRVIQ
ncbi:MAG: hypothetical protein JNM68_11345 [Dinghuibacter sp.]|nr:hypothetical protein [Dinghuibacter sp.]